MSVVFSEKFMRELEKSLGSDRALRITSALGPIIESDPIMRTAPEVAAQTVIGMAKMLGPRCLGGRDHRSLPAGDGGPQPRQVGEEEVVAIRALTATKKAGSRRPPP